MIYIKHTRLDTERRRAANPIVRAENVSSPVLKTRDAQNGNQADDQEVEDDGDQNLQLGKLQLLVPESHKP